MSPIDLQAEFPIREQYTFLNHAAVSPIPLSTQFAISEFARDAAEEGPANYPAWMHGMSNTRAAAAKLVNCDPNDLCFVKNTTHGLLIVVNSIRWREGDNVVGFAHEFPANVHPWRNLRERGVEFRVVQESSDYTFRIEDVERLIDSRTRLLACSWVEYSTGVRNDLAALGELCRSRRVLFCVDAIQGLGAIPLDLSALKVDFLSADGHKWLLAPEGCGIMYVRREIIPDLNTSMCGWIGLKNPAEYDNYDQPLRPDARRFEEGSHNLMSITALGASIRLLLDVGTDEIQSRVLALTDRLIAGAESRGFQVITPRDPEKRAGIVAFAKRGLDALEAAKRLEQEKIIVAARRGFVRVSPHFYNDEQQIDGCLEALAKLG